MRLLLIVLSAVLIVSAPARAGCIADTREQFQHDTQKVEHRLRNLPRNIVKPHNLEWELPIAAATAVLIGAVDVPASRGVRSHTVVENSDWASNLLLGVDLGAAGLTYAIGCISDHEPNGHVRPAKTLAEPARNRPLHAGFAALEAAGAATAFDLALKAATNREYPNKWNGEGRFWHGGKSFPSGHSAASWSIAAALAHQYPHQRWVKWAAYSTAASISLLRFPAKKHFPSDILVGSTIGYVVGTSLGTK